MPEPVAPRARQPAPAQDTAEPPPPAAAPGEADPVLAAVIDWWTGSARPLPWRATRDIYAVWISEVMSAQTSVGRAAGAWVCWMERWPTVHALAGATLTEVLVQWQGLGYPRRARDLHRAARIVATAGWPEDLTTLPGVGPYVAAAVRCFAREEPVLPVDVNVRRVLGRRFPAGVDIAADPWRAGQAIMEFGQRICSARPRCKQCPVQQGCAGPGEDAATAVRRQPPFAGSVRQRRGRLLRRVLAEGAIGVDPADESIARGLCADGLAVLRGGILSAPD